MELTTAQRSSLQTLRYQPVWELLLDVMQQEVEVMETELLRAPAHDAAQIVAAHNKAQAARVFFERFQKSIQEMAKNPEELSPKQKQLAAIDIIKAQL